MVDNSEARDRLIKIETTLDDMSDTKEMARIIGKKAASLFEVLSSTYSGNLYVDDDIRNLVDRIYDKLNIELEGEIREKYNELNRIYNTAPGGSAGKIQKDPAIKDWVNLNSIASIPAGTGIGTDVTTVAKTPNLQRRCNEYDRINKHIVGFNSNFSINDLDINVTTLNGTRVGGEIDLAGWRITGTPVAIAPDYEICDSDGKKLESCGTNKYKITQGKIDYTLTIRLNGTKYELLDVSPKDRTPQTLELSINASCKNVLPGLNVVHNKKFKLNLTQTNTTALLNTPNSREVVFNDFNNAGSILETFNNQIGYYEKDDGRKNMKALDKLFKKRGITTYDSLSQKEKLAFYKQLCDGGYFQTILQTGGTIGDSVGRFDKFRDRFVHDDRERNKDKHITSSNSTYRAFITDNMGKKCDEYISSMILEYLEGQPIDAEFSKFKNESKSNNKSSADDAASALERNEHKMKKNYLGFLSGSSAEKHDQRVKIFSGSDSCEEIKYNMDLSVTSSNSIRINVTIGGETIDQSFGDPRKLAIYILKEKQIIKEPKVRCHIGLNIYKSFIEMAQKRNIPLTYRYEKNKIRKLSVENGQIVIKELQFSSRNGEVNEIQVFDEKSFNDEIGKFDDAISELSRHFNMCMSNLENQYSEGIKDLKTDLPKQRNNEGNNGSRLTRKESNTTKPNYDFNFHKRINCRGKDVSITFENNVFTVRIGNSTNTLETFQDKDLGKLLNSKKGGVKVFEGMERDIIAGFFSNIMEKFKSVEKIRNLYFGVMDNNGNVYIRYPDGSFGCIYKEKLKLNPIKGKKEGLIDVKKLNELSGSVHRLTENEKKELYRDPTIMSRFIKAMNKEI